MPCGRSGRYHVRHQFQPIGTRRSSMDMLMGKSPVRSAMTRATIRRLSAPTGSSDVDMNSPTLPHLRSPKLTLGRPGSGRRRALAPHRVLFGRSRPPFATACVSRSPSAMASRCRYTRPECQVPVVGIWACSRVPLIGRGATPNLVHSGGRYEAWFSSHRGREVGSAWPDRNLARDGPLTQTVHRRSNPSVRQKGDQE